MKLPVSAHNLDQHFLNEEGAKQLVALAGIREDYVVVDVGAGHGALLKQLPQCKQLHAIELDPALANELRETFPNITVHQGDALQVLPKLSADVILSNAPFTIAEPLLYELLRLTFRKAVLLLPLTLADMLAQQKGILGLYASAFLNVEYCKPFDARHLSPMPDSSLALIALSPKTGRSEQEQLLFELFTQRDKKTGNALREAFCRKGSTKRQSTELVKSKVSAQILERNVPRLSEQDLREILAALAQ